MIYEQSFPAGPHLFEAGNRLTEPTASSDLADFDGEVRTSIFSRLLVISRCDEQVLYERWPFGDLVEGVIMLMRKELLLFLEI